MPPPQPTIVYFRPGHSVDKNRVRGYVEMHCMTKCTQLE